LCTCPHGVNVNVIAPGNRDDEREYRKAPENAAIRERLQREREQGLLPIRTKLPAQLFLASDDGNVWATVYDRDTAGY
jgi:NAD(P)-dependent dehydrogenase (short-subunit alcohol dehydrogenase family)